VKKNLSIDTETSTLVGKHDLIMIDHSTGKSQIIDIKTKANQDLYSHIADAMAYGIGTKKVVASGRAMGKSAALGMLYGSPGYGKSSVPWTIDTEGLWWNTMRRMVQEMEERRLAQLSELGKVLYGKD
jgi:hypothetical protein